MIALLLQYLNTCCLIKKKDNLTRLKYSAWIRVSLNTALGKAYMYRYAQLFFSCYNVAMKITFGFPTEYIRWSGGGGGGGGGGDTIGACAQELLKLEAGLQFVFRQSQG